MASAGRSGASVTSVFARTLFDGVADEPRADQLITIANGQIAGCEAVRPDAVPEEAFRAEIVAPGFIDLQINGAADVQFNDVPTIDGLAEIARGAREGGTAHLLPTFITDEGDRYRLALEAVDAALKERLPGVLGTHLEGPFLSPERPGIHPARFIRPLTKTDVETIAAAKGPVLVTLAPEEQDLALVSALSAAGVSVFAGHTEARQEDILRAIGAGLRGVTHVFNAQSQIAGREPGTVGTALMHPHLFAGIIADGHHVHPQNLDMAARLKGDRLFLVTDAMRSLAGKVAAFDLLGTPVTLCGGRLTGPDGTLAGAHLAMDEAVRNAVDLMNVPLASALKMASGNAARAIGLSGLGEAVEGFRASLTCLSPSLRTQAVIVDGQLFAL